MIVGKGSIKKTKQNKTKNKPHTHRKKDVGTSLKQKHENDLIATRTKFPRSVVSFLITARNCHLEDSQKSETLPMESLTKLFFFLPVDQKNMKSPIPLQQSPPVMIYSHLSKTG